MRTSSEILRERRRIWKSKEILRRLYRQWSSIIASALRPGKILELGGGSGHLREFFPNAIVSDVLFAPWLDAALDAHDLPFRDETLDSIVLCDVLHHLTEPTNLFYEAERVLKSEGRIVLIEPYVSWASFLVYRFFHAEGMVWHVDPFKKRGPWKGKDPLYGNQAIPTLIFEKYRKQFIKNFPRLEIIKEKRMDFIVYPLSGGFHNPSLSPPFMWDALDYFERLLSPLDRYLAFRLFVVIERI